MKTCIKCYYCSQYGDIGWCDVYNYPVELEVAKKCKAYCLDTEVDSIKTKKGGSKMRQWGKIGVNKLQRALDKKDLRRLRKGKSVEIRVNGHTIELVNKDFIHPESKLIKRLQIRIDRLVAKKNALESSCGK